MNKKAELQELYEFKLMVQSRLFQKYIMEPLTKEIENLKNAYDCENLKDLHTLKGKEKGLKFLINILKEDENTLKNLKFEIDNTAD